MSVLINQTQVSDVKGESKVGCGHGENGRLLAAMVVCIEFSPAYSGSPSVTGNPLGSLTQVKRLAAQCRQAITGR